MANEAVTRFPADPLVIPFTVGAGAIVKGQWCKGLDPMTASGAHTMGDVCAGYAARDQVNGDSRNKLGMIRQAYAEVTISGAGVDYGSPLILSSSANHLALARPTDSGASIVGHALEAASTGEVIMAYIDIGAGGKQLS